MRELNFCIFNEHADETEEYFHVEVPDDTTNRQVADRLFAQSTVDDGRLYNDYDYARKFLEEAGLSPEIRTIGRHPLPHDDWNVVMIEICSTKDGDLYTSYVGFIHFDNEEFDNTLYEQKGPPATVDRLRGRS